MNDVTQTLVRSVLKILTGWLLSKGLADESTAEAITGGGIGLVAVIWGVLHRSSAKAQTVSINKLPLLLALSAALFFGGCNSTPQRIAFNTESGVAIGADTAMSMWGDYVKQYHPPVAQEQKVSDLYGQYQSAALAAVDASNALAALASSGSTNTATVQAQSDLAHQKEAQALTELVNFLRTIGVKL